jgi:hypothetical protein
MEATAVNRMNPGKRGSIDTPNPKSSGDDEPTDVIGQAGEKFAPVGMRIGDTWWKFIHVAEVPSLFVETDVDWPLQ